MEHQPYVDPPKVIFPLSQETGVQEILNDEIQGTETNVAFDQIWTPPGLIGSPIFDSYLNHQSLISFQMKNSLKLTKQLTIMMWIKPFKLDQEYLLFDATFDDGTDVHFLKIKTNNELIKISTNDPQGGIVDYETSIDLTLKENDWNFLAATFNGDSSLGAIFLNEGFGQGDNSTVYFPFVSHKWIPNIFNGDEVTLGGKLGSDIAAFDGSISCLQIFDYSMDPATVHLKKYCPDIPEKQEQLCPSAYSYFDGICYGVQYSQGALTFPQAEVACLSQPDSPYEKRLAWTENLEHWDFMVFLAKEQTGKTSIWAGISDRDEDTFYVNSLGTNITAESDLFSDSMDPSMTCGVVEYGDNGYVKTDKCINENIAVCMTKPMYSPPDYNCPSGFYPYRDTCLYPYIRQETFDEAMKLCASKGAIVLPIKDVEMHEFVAAWGPSAVQNDMWVGLRKKIHLQQFDDDASLFQPLQEDWLEEFAYTDGVRFDIETMYTLGEKKLNGECLSLKQSSEFELRDGSCEKEKAFICLWTAPDCPEDYFYVGQLSDGRTCHAVLESGEGNFFETATCEVATDVLREKYTPSTPYQLDRFRRFFL